MRQPDETYSDKEIIMILASCKTIYEINQVKKSLGYLNRNGVQRIRGVVYKLSELRIKEIFNKDLKNGRNTKGNN